MSVFRNILLFLGMAVFLEASPAAAQSYTFTTVDLPGATVTTVFDVDSNGRIVGTFNENTVAHGFVGTVTSLTQIDVPVPGAVTTFANGLNDAGQVVGRYHFSDPHVWDGFLMSGGSFTTINVPGSPTTLASDINNAGVVVGSFATGTQSAQGVARGFVWNGGMFTEIAVPAAGGYRTEAYGLNDVGQIVGGFDQPIPGGALSQAFILEGGSFTTFGFPGTGPGYRTQANAINNAGVVVGFFGAASGFPTHGFIRDGQGIRAFDVPGASSTLPFGISDSGIIVGSFEDATRRTHGFVAVPSIPEPSVSALSVVGLLMIAALRGIHRSRRPPQV